MVLRERFWIDDQVQGVLMGRIVIYWVASLIYFGASAAAFQWMANSELTVQENLGVLFDAAWPCIPSAVLLLPLVMVDIVRLSNRFVGPIYRVRNHLARLLKDSRTYPLTFRDGDYWTYLATPINTLQEHIISLEDEVVRLKAELAVAKEFQESFVAVQSGEPETAKS